MIPLYHCYSELSQAGNEILQWLTLRYLHHQLNRLEFYFLSKLVIGNFSWSHRCWLSERKGNISGVGAIDGHFLMQLTCAFRICLNLVSYIPLMFDDRVLLCPSLITWCIRQHLVHERQFRLHGIVMVCGEAISLYEGPVTKPEVFLKGENLSTENL